MAKRNTTTTRKPQDATLRNVRAAAKRMEKVQRDLEGYVAHVKALESRVLALEALSVRRSALHKVDARLAALARQLEDLEATVHALRSATVTEGPEAGAHLSGVEVGGR